MRNPFRKRTDGKIHLDLTIEEAQMLWGVLIDSPIDLMTKHDQRIVFRLDRMLRGKKI